MTPCLVHLCLCGHAGSTPLLCRVASPCVNATPVILSLVCGHLGLLLGAVMSEAAESLRTQHLCVDGHMFSFLWGKPEEWACSLVGQKSVPLQRIMPDVFQRLFYLLHLHNAVCERSGCSILGQHCCCRSFSCWLFRWRLEDLTVGFMDTSVMTRLPRMGGVASILKAAS